MRERTVHEFCEAIRRAIDVETERQHVLEIAYSKCRELEAQIGSVADLCHDPSERLFFPKSGEVWTVFGEAFKGGRAGCSHRKTISGGLTLNFWPTRFERLTSISEERAMREAKFNGRNRVEFLETLRMESEIRW